MYFCKIEVQVRDILLKEHTSFYGKRYTYVIEDYSIIIIIITRYYTQGCMIIILCILYRVVDWMKSIVHALCTYL